MKQVIDQLATCLESHPLPALAFPSHAYHVPGIPPVAFVQCRFRNSASVSRLIRLTGYLFTVTKRALGAQLFVEGVLNLSGVKLAQLRHVFGASLPSSCTASP